MNDPTETIGNNIRVLMAKFARVLDQVTHGRLRPAHITTLSFVGHIPAAWALWINRPYLAAGLIAGFGLLDALDGALAREQKTASKLGMFFDAVTDRMKEILLYSGLAVFVTQAYQNEIAVWVVPAVAGTSLLVSYVKAKGEMAVSSSAHDKQILNRAFSQGIARYEIRMFLLIFGLLTGLLPAMLNLIIALNLITASLRFVEIARLLTLEDNQQTAAAKRKNKSTSDTKDV